MSSAALVRPLESLDEWLTGLLDGAPLLVSLAIAFVSECATPPTPTTSSR